MAEPQTPDLPDIPALVTKWAGNFSRNTSSAFARMTAKDWIRMIIFVGAYLLLRPYLVKFGAKFQQKQFEKQIEEEKAEAKEQADERRKRKAAKAGLSPNDIRVGRKIDIPGVDTDSEDEDEEREEGAAEWGRKARVRQRKTIRKIMEQHEKKLQEKGNESDKDIEDLLED
jgi:Protein trafficking PGA2